MSDINEKLDGPGWYSMTACEQDVLRLKAVKEIKELRKTIDMMHSSKHADVMGLDEIERLRAALEKSRDCDRCWRHVREALGDE